MLVGRCRYEDLEQSPDEGAGWEVSDPSTKLMLGPVESHAETGKGYTNILTTSVSLISWRSSQSSQWNREHFG